MNALDTTASLWLATEQVYSAEGNRVGTLHQERSLVTSQPGYIEMTQVISTPDMSLEAPAARLGGTWHCLVRNEGRVRQYTGADLVGTALAWGDSLVTNEVFWPRLGWMSRSLLFGITERLYLKTRMFYTAAHCVAYTYGLLRQADSGDAAFPEPASFAEAAHGTWHGQYITYNRNGTLRRHGSIQRQFIASGYQDTIGGHMLPAVHIQRFHNEHHYRSETLTGVGKQFGAVTELDLISTDTFEHQKIIEIAYPEQEILVRVSHLYSSGELDGLSVVLLKHNGPINFAAPNPETSSGNPQV